MALSFRLHRFSIRSLSELCFRVQGVLINLFEIELSEDVQTSPDRNADNLFTLEVQKFQ